MFPVEVTFLSALLIGFVGSSHCIGMCGGVVGMLTVSEAGEDDLRGPGASLARVIAYNVGRISSYVAAGLLIGGLGGGVFDLLPQATARGLGALLSALFLIALGLYLGGWWPLLAILERQGARLWRVIEPLGRRLLPVRSLPQALMLGLVWGWLPCGLVYSALAWSLASSSAEQGALLMLGFGLGTLPVLVLLGTLGSAVKRFSQLRLVRQSAGAVLIVVGMFGLVTLLTGQSQHPYRHADTGHLACLSTFSDHA